MPIGSRKLIPPLLALAALVLAGAAGNGGCFEGFFVESAQQLCANTGGTWNEGGCTCPGTASAWRDGYGCDVAPRPDVYAIVVSRSTAAGAWSEVVDLLRTKHVNAKVFNYGSNPSEVKASLKGYFPKYVVFVHEPPVPRAFIQDQVVPMMRSIDDDPFEDAVWAVLTGYTIDDAKRIVNAEPLRIGVGCSHVGSGWLDWFESGVSWNECEKNVKYTKDAGYPVEQVQGPSETALEMATALAQGDKQCVSTSGHASEHDWLPGYAYSDGRFYSKAGELYVQALDGKNYTFTTSNPKIYYSPGNCLIAHQPDMDAMSLAWIHNGVNAFFGHVIKQGGDGCVAFGIADFFFALQDRFTYAEAVYLNRQAAMVRPEGPTACLQGTVLYGDPAWDARMKRSTTPRYEQSVSVEEQGDGRTQITFTITMNATAGLGQLASAAAFLPFRVSEPTLVSCGGDTCTMSDNIVVLRKEGSLAAGTSYTAVFTAKKASL